MAAGTIKKLVNDKGFGFIQMGDGGDIFFHHSTVQNAQFDTLTELLEVIGLGPIRRQNPGHSGISRSGRSGPIQRFGAHISAGHTDPLAINLRGAPPCDTLNYRSSYGNMT